MLRLATIRRLRLHRLDSGLHDLHQKDFDSNVGQNRCGFLLLLCEWSNQQEWKESSQPKPSQLEHRQLEHVQAA